MEEEGGEEEEKEEEEEPAMPSCDREREKEREREKFIDNQRERAKRECVVYWYSI